MNRKHPATKTRVVNACDCLRTALMCFATVGCTACSIGCVSKTPEQKAILALAHGESLRANDVLEVLLIDARSPETESRRRIALLTNVASVYAGANEQDRARSLFREAIALADGPNFDARLEIAEAQVASGFLEEAVKSLELNASPHETSRFRSEATARVEKIVMEFVEQGDFASAKRLLSQLPNTKADALREQIQLSRSLLAGDVASAKLLARQLKSGDARAELMLRIANVETARGDQLAARETLREAAASVSSGMSAELLELMTQTESRQQELMPKILSRQTQIKDFEGALQTLKRFDDTRTAYRGLAEIIGGLAHDGQFDRAIALAVLVQGVTLEDTGNWARRLKQSADRREEFERLGVNQIADSLLMMEEANLSRQKFRERRESQNVGISPFLSDGGHACAFRNYLLQTSTLLAIAESQDSAGRAHDAQATRDRAIANVATFPGEDRCRGLALVGEDAAARGQREKAIEHFGQSIKVAATIDEEESRSAVLEFIVLRLCAAGYWDAAEQTAEQIPEEFRRKWAVRDIAKMSLEHGRIEDALRISRAHAQDLWSVFLAIAAKHAADGRTERARELFREALTLESGLDPSHPAVQIREVAEEQSKAGLGLDALESINRIVEPLDRRQTTIAVIKQHPAPSKEKAFIRRAIERISQEDDAYWRAESLLALARAIQELSLAVKHRDE